MKTLICTLLTFTTIAAFGQSDGDLTERIKRYEGSGPVRKTLIYMDQNVLEASQGLCARYVRLGFMSSHMISFPGIDYAKDYLPFFNREGWTNLFNSSAIMSDLNNTPAGCAITYGAINPQNDRNGYIGHIEVRTKGLKKSGFISDYFSSNPRTGLECVQKGRVVTKTRVFIVRNSSPYERAGSKVVKNIQVTTCDKYSSRGALVSDEFLNRKVIGISCKLD